MKVILQRVLNASVTVDGVCVGSCKHGYCVLVGIAPTDTQQDMSFMAQKIVHLRVFADENGKMNKSILDINGSMLIISQFTLLADCQTGRRPSFTGAGNPQKAKELFDDFVHEVQSLSIPVQTGIFGADMIVHIENDGPATFILESSSYDKNKKNN